MQRTLRAPIERVFDVRSDHTGYATRLAARKMTRTFGVALAAVEQTYAREASA